jgi:tRNA(fMet)-specific endonuclease VapC
MIYIFDTDHVSLFLRGYSPVVQKVQATFTEESESFFITIITVQELFNGWLTRLNSTQNPEELLSLYGKFWQTLSFIRESKVLNFDAEASACYQSLLTRKSLHKKRLLKDLRIAAIAISTGGVLVTRNYKDFQGIPQLKFEDWS